MRKLESLAKRLRDRGRQENPPKVHRGELAQDYDGFAQHAAVRFSKSSAAMALRARINSGDFHTGVILPTGTPITLYVDHGKVTVISLGYR